MLHASFAKEAHELAHQMEVMTNSDLKPTKVERTPSPPTPRAIQQTLQKLEADLEQDLKKGASTLESALKELDMTAESNDLQPTKVEKTPSSSASDEGLSRKMERKDQKLDALDQCRRFIDHSRSRMKMVSVAAGACIGAARIQSGKQHLPGVNELDTHEFNA